MSFQLSLASPKNKVNIGLVTKGWNILTIFVACLRCASLKTILAYFFGVVDNLVSYESFPNNLITLFTQKIKLMEDFFPYIVEHVHNITYPSLKHGPHLPFHYFFFPTKHKKKKLK